MSEEDANEDNDAWLADDIGKWQADDEAAAAFAQQRPLAARRARWLFGALAVGAALAGLGIVLVAAFAERAAAGGRLDNDANNRVAMGVLGAVAVGVPAYVGYCVASWRGLRSAQRRVKEWLILRGEEQADRGLPPVLRKGLDEYPAHKLKGLAAGVAGFVALALLIAGLVMLTLEEHERPPPAFGVASIGLGLALGVVAVGLFVSDHKAAERQKDLERALGGRRVVLEEQILVALINDSLSPDAGTDEPG